MNNTASDCSATTPPVCFHCGLDCIPGDTFAARIDGELRAMCCAGCEAVANAIVSAGLTEYYHHRDTSEEGQHKPLVPAELSSAKLYDSESITHQYVTKSADGTNETLLMLEGLTCAACAWLVEHRLYKLNGVVRANVNFAALTLNIEWDGDQLALSEIVACVEGLGFAAAPYEPRQQYQALISERKSMLTRIAVAAGFGMQVMIVSVAMYFGEYQGMDARIENFLRQVALLLTLPVLIYSARGFFRASWQQLQVFKLGMDVPITIGLTLAFCASVWATMRGQGHVYFDSVCMFVFFVLVARYFVHAARLNAAHDIERLGQSVPLVAQRLDQKHPGASAQPVAAFALQADDWVRVLENYPVPVDGVVVDGASALDQSILTGESAPVEVGIGDRVIAGSVNLRSTLVIKARAIGDATVLSGIARLAREALTAKARENRLVQVIVKYFVTAVLILASLTASYWHLQGSDNTLSITIAVLVVACPCALSLAIPVAQSVATSALFKQGVLVSKVDALERFAALDEVVIDKTGTLTLDMPRIDSTEHYTDFPTERAVAIAQALELQSDHPIAAAFRGISAGQSIELQDWRQEVGAGVSATIAGERYFLGSARYIAAQLCVEQRELIDSDSGGVYLANERLLTQFHLGQTLRDGAREWVEHCMARKMRVTMLTGDAIAPAQNLATALGIEHYIANATPEEKLEYVQKRQAAGARVLMIGDGVNDSPVLAQADASVAVAGATPLAVRGADLVLVSQSLDVLDTVLARAAKLRRVMRQNLTWALIYNAVAVSLAALGWITPLFAAIGMSLSSILVVVNAQRLK